GVSQAILSLLEHGRLSATCAMTNRPHWSRFAPALRDYGGRADLGLHLNLTCAAPCGPMPAVAPTGILPALADLGRAAMGSARARLEIASEIERQLDAYEAAMGSAPDFVDGHQHVHVLPGVRRSLLDALQRRYGAAAPYVRHPSDRVASIRARRLFLSKALTVRTLATGFAAMAHRRGLATNQGFSGFSDFNAANDYANYFRSYLIAPGQQHLVMCHPGHVDAELQSLDPVREARQNEYDFLAGENFLTALADARVKLARFKDISAAGLK
ncbi:MAG: ChbG/HpnK family deacetylase, partial [Beijerinckiaceae bacterium]